jgi:hypothetical protein
LYRDVRQGAACCAPAAESIPNVSLLRDVRELS